MFQCCMFVSPLCLLWLGGGGAFASESRFFLEELCHRPVRLRCTFGPPGFRFLVFALRGVTAGQYWRRWSLHIPFFESRRRGGEEVMVFGLGRGWGNRVAMSSSEAKSGFLRS